MVIRKHIVYAWSLVCPVIRCNLVAHGRICVHKRLKFVFLTPLFWEDFSCSFQTQMEVWKWLQGYSWRATETLWTPWMKVMREWMRALWERKCLLTSLPVLLNSTIPQKSPWARRWKDEYTVSGPACTRTHEHAIHWIPVMTQLWMNLNWVNIRFDLSNLFCKK